MDLRSVAESWRDQDDPEGRFVHLEIIPARPPIWGDLDPPLPGALRQRLQERGIERLFRHQAQAIDRVRRGVHTVVVSGTASGKSLCYQAPMVEAILEAPKTTTLAVFPTKALAQDQLRSLIALRLPGLVAASYDGDTTPDARRWARRHANVILTNPDMLHLGILPNHRRWADFLLRLRFVVVDEMHTLRGVFGSHVAHVLRRLRRVAAGYGSEPTFVFSSATIGNPGDLASRLTGLPVEVVDQDDSPAGEKLTVLWNPPLDPDTDRRRSSLSETTDLLVDLVERGIPTIVFTRSRKATELIYAWASGRLGPELKGKLAPYRGGYLPEARRAIEQRLFGGDLLGVIATNALELGVDIGSLDAALLNTFPGTLASFRQQAGRAGRGKAQALAVLIAGEDALDQYFMTHPGQLFGRPSEAVVVNPDNPLVAEAHAACAAFEAPLSLNDRDFLPAAVEEAANRLVQSGRAQLRDGRLHWTDRQPPAPSIDLRSSGGPTYRILDLDTGELLGTVEQERAFSQTHEGAVYLHLGDTYLVVALDHRALEVRVRRHDADFYTEPRVDQHLEVLEVEAQQAVGLLPYHLGRIRVERQVVGFQRRRIGSRERLGFEPLDLPPSRFETEGVWYGVPSPVVERVPLQDLLGALHAAEHTGIGVLPLFAVCDRWDIGGLSTNYHPATGGAAVFIYEAYAGGAGISPVAFQLAEAHQRATLETLRTCPCSSGCPSCVQSPKCGNFNEPLSKSGARMLLEAALGS